ncbi:hypothetical protein BDZ91DRAFT_797555 [Kalaharituber pfeilii]|nr:hypothetical protein BDZ91DRAFT_797555 [Kalaharituber pfeilii]
MEYDLDSEFNSEYSSEEEEEDLEELQELIDRSDNIAANRYFNRGKNSAGRQDSNILSNLINEYPDSAFLAIFQMQRASFWYHAVQCGEPDRYEAYRVALPGTYDNDVAELAAVLEACRVALMQADGSSGSGKIYILTDSQYVVRVALDGQFKARSRLEHELLRMSHRLADKGVEGYMIWIPAHLGIAGNSRADKEAKRAVVDPGWRMQGVPGQLTVAEARARDRRWGRGGRGG